MGSATSGRTGQLVGKCIFLVVGLVFLFGSLISAFRTQLFLSKCVTVQGRIAGFKAVSTSRHNSLSYAPIFGFGVEDGHFVTVVSHTSSSPPAFKVGELVTVRYPAGHPEAAVIDTFGQLWLMDLAVGSFGAVFFAVGLLTLVSGWRRGRRNLAFANADADVGIVRR
jgi:hypothetical protein